MLTLPTGLSNCVHLRPLILGPLLILVEILFRHVVLGELARSNFFFVSILRGFYTADDTGFERVPLIQQFPNAFGIRAFHGR